MTLNYILETTVCWLFFYLLYALWLRKETFFRTNRIYLMGTLLLGLLIPAVDVMPTPQAVVIQDVTVYLNEVVVLAQGNVATSDTGFHISTILMAVYQVGVAVFLLRFLVSMGSIFRLFLNSEIIKKENYTLVYTSREHAPFSFLNFFFVYKKNEFNETEWQQITRHEEAHIRGAHTFDVLLAEVLTILFWFNPLIYMYKYAIRNVHEYLADAAVIKTVPTVHYGQFLVSFALPGFRMANNFNHSQLKKRIIMMTKTQSSKFALAKYTLFIPLALILFVIFSCKDDVQNLITDDVTEHQQRVLVYDENEGVAREYIKAHKKAEDGNGKTHFDKVEEVTISALKVFEQKMSTEYEQETNPAKKEALKERFLDELKQGAEDARVTFFIVEKGEDGIEKMCTTGNKGDNPFKKLNKKEIEENVRSIEQEKDPDKRRSMINDFEVGIKNKTGKNINFGVSEETNVYTIVDEMPLFPGCGYETDAEKRKKCAEKQMLQYIYTNITYPAEAIEAGIEGIAIVSFVVETDGQITHPKILRSVGYETDEEVIRIVENMPDWIPGIHEGKAVRVKFNLPVRFKLEK